MNFKEQLQADVHSTFLNVDEFADVHTVNGRQMNMLVDGNELKEREMRFSQHMDGAYSDEVLIYVAADVYGDIPTRGEVVNFDGTDYRVMDAVDEYGMYALTLSRTAAIGRSNRLGIPRRG